MSADDRPSLRAVSDEDTPRIESEDLLAKAAPGLPQQQPQKRADRSWLSALLGLALVAACLGYLYQEQRASEFETRASVLQTELEVARVKRMLTGIRRQLRSIGWGLSSPA